MKQSVRVILLLVLVPVLSLGLLANGLNLNGNGSKAVSMGGAFVGLADDYSAVYWNPAGLTQLKGSSLSMFVTDVIPTNTYQLAPYGIDATSKTTHYVSGGFGFAKSISEKVSVALYAYVPSGAGAHWDPADVAVLSGGSQLEWKSLVGIATFSPAVAVKVSEKLSIGATLNINYGLIKMKRPSYLGPLLGFQQYEEDLNGLSVGATMGLLFKPSQKFSWGLTYKTPLSVKVSGEASFTGINLMGLSNTDDAERTTTWPMWIGTGICFKPNEKLTLTADVQFTNWKEMTVIPMEFYSDVWKAYFEEGASFELKWKDTIQLRFGMEYKLSDTFALRAGYYYDPDPAPKSTQTIILPEITYNFVTVGFGYKTGALTLDFCLEYGFGQDSVVSPQEADPKAGMPGIHGANIFVPNLSLTLHL